MSILGKVLRSNRYYDPTEMGGLGTFNEEEKAGDFAFYGLLIDPRTGDPSPVFRRLIDSLFSYVDRHAEPHHTEHIEPMKVAWYSRQMGDASPDVYTRHPWYLQTYYEQMKIPYEFVLSPNHPGQQIPILNREGYLADWIVTVRTEPKDGFMALRRAIDRFHLVDPLTGYRFPLLPWKSFPQTGSATLRHDRERWHSRSHERLQQTMHEVGDLYEQHADRVRDRVSSRYSGGGTYVGGAYGYGGHDINPNNAYIYNHGPSSRMFMGPQASAAAAYAAGHMHHDAHHYGHHGYPYGSHGGHGHGYSQHGMYGHSHSHSHGEPYPMYGAHSHHSSQHGGGSHHSNHSDHGRDRERGRSRSRSRSRSRERRKEREQTSRERERERERERQIERQYEQERDVYAANSSYAGSSGRRSRPSSRNAERNEDRYERRDERYERRDERYERRDEKHSRDGERDDSEDERQDRRRGRRGSDAGRSRGSRGSRGS